MLRCQLFLIHHIGISTFDIKQKCLLVTGESNEASFAKVQIHNLWPQLRYK